MRVVPKGAGPKAAGVECLIQTFKYSNDSNRPFGDIPVAREQTVKIDEAKVPREGLVRTEYHLDQGLLRLNPPI
jgi:hypothetical protein